MKRTNPVEELKRLESLPEEPMPRKLLDDYGAAEVLALSPRQVKRLVNRNEITYVKMPNGQVRFDPADLQTWIDQHKHPSNSLRDEKASSVAENASAQKAG